VEEARGDAGLKSLLVALLVVGLLAGCGDDHKDTARGTTTTSEPLSKTAYENSFKAIVKRFEGAPAIDAPPDATPQEQGAALEKGLERTRALADELERLDPPADIRHAHEQFVAGMREIADQAEKAVTALKAGDEARAQRLVGSFAKPATIAKITAARREFARKGYDLGETSPSP
jgi:predicted oxidoreductase